MLEKRSWALGYTFNALKFHSLHIVHSTILLTARNQRHYLSNINDNATYFFSPSPPLG